MEPNTRQLKDAIMALQGRDGLVRTNRERDGKSWWRGAEGAKATSLLTSAPAALALIPQTLDVELRTASEGADFPKV